jgi:signal transduction histidine kinase
MWGEFLCLGLIVLMQSVILPGGIRPLEMRYSQWVLVLFFVMFLLGRFESAVLTKRARALEAAFENLNHRLQDSEQCVCQKDRALEQEMATRLLTQSAMGELLKDKQDAEIADRAKRDFLADMSHEMRTPLTTILGFSSLLADDPNLTRRQYEYLQAVVRSGDYLLALIDDILDLAKVEAGCVEVRPVVFDLYEMFQELEEMFRFHADQKGLSLNFERAPDIPQYIRADQGRMRQILINLMSNAIKFTPRGSVIIRVSVKDNTVRA